MSNENEQFRLVETLGELLGDSAKKIESIVALNARLTLGHANGIEVNAKREGKFEMVKEHDDIEECIELACEARNAFEKILSILQKGSVSRKPKERPKAVPRYGEGNMPFCNENCPKTEDIRADSVLEGVNYECDRILDESCESTETLLSSRQHIRSSKLEEKEDMFAEVMMNTRVLGIKIYEVLYRKLIRILI